MTVLVTYVASVRPETEIPCMYRVLTVDGVETNRTMVGLEEVLATEPSVATEYKSAVLAKLESLVQTFKDSTQFDSLLHEQSAITMQCLDIFVGNYSDNMLPPVNP